MKHNCLYKSRKTAAVLTTLLACSCGIISARGQTPQAVYRFANASAIPDNVLFTNDTRKLRPNGFGPGENTSAIGTPAGPHRFAASAPSAKPFETPLTLQPNTATTIVAFTKSVLDPVTRKTVQQLQLFSQADPAREKGKHFYLLYVSGRPVVDLVVNAQPRNLPALRQLKADDVARGSLKIESAGKPVLDFSAEQSGNFLAIIFDKPDGTLGGMLLPDYD